MQKFMKKLGSRKFWALVASLVSSNMILFGYAEADIVKVTAVVTAAGSVIAYLLVEGSIDKEDRKQQVYIVPGSAPKPKDQEPEDEASFR